MKNRLRRICLLLVLCLCMECNIGFTEQVKAVETTKPTATRGTGLKIKVVSVSKKQIKIEFINKSDAVQNYPKDFTLYQWKKGTWKKVSRSYRVPKCVYPVDAHDSKIEKIVFKEHFHLKKNLSKGKYKIKCYGTASTCFRIK